MTHGEPVQFLGLRLSRTVLANHAEGVDAAVMQPIRHHAGLGWLRRYLGALLSEPGVGDSLAAPGEVRQLIMSHVYDLVGSAITSLRGSAMALGGRGVRAARLLAIKSHIVANLGSTELSVVAVAAQHGITPRYLHKLFEGDGTTYSAFVLSQRLARVHRSLSDLRFAGRAVSALALDAGFGDLSYFNREFRRRYDATPSEIRREALRRSLLLAGAAPPTAAERDAPLL